jgi:hypothetical protein
MQFGCHGDSRCVTPADELHLLDQWR